MRSRCYNTCDGKVYIVSEGELIIFYPSSVHSIYPVDSSPILFAGIKFDSVKFQNTSSYAPYVAAILRYARTRDMQMHFNAGQAEMLHSREIFSDCVKETRQCQYGRDIMLRTNIYRLILGIVRYWISLGFDINSCPISPAEIYGIENIVEYLLFTDHDLAFISLRTGFSDSSHLIRCFKKHTGLTPKQFKLSKKQLH